MFIRIEHQGLVKTKVKENQRLNAIEDRDDNDALRRHIRQVVKRNYPGIDRDSLERIVEVRLRRGMTEYIALDVSFKHVDDGFAKSVWQERKVKRQSIVLANHANRK